MPVSLSINYGLWPRYILAVWFILIFSYLLSHLTGIVGCFYKAELQVLMETAGRHYIVTTSPPTAYKLISLPTEGGREGGRNKLNKQISGPENLLVSSQTRARVYDLIGLN